LTAQPSGSPLTINTGGGDDVVGVAASETTNFNGVTIDGGPGNNTLGVVDISGGGVVRNFPVSPNSGTVAVIYPDSRDFISYLNFPNIGGSLDANRNYIISLFHQILGRSPTAGELTTFTNLLLSQGRLDVVTTLERSQEGRTHLVDGWFLQYLGRPANPGEDTPFVQALLAGEAEEDVLSSLTGNSAFFHSNDYRNQQVFAYYERLVLRVPSQTEVNNWVFTSNSIETIRELLEISDEYYNVGI
jgi:hypothetical protein